MHPSTEVLNYMPKLIGLIALAVVFPAVWGWSVHWLALRLWPAERRRTAPWPSATASPATPDFLDYQI
jgi:hypothetical protein